MTFVIHDKVFRQLLASSCLPLLERLCCLLTASDILQGEGEALNIDNRDYYQQLYWTLKHWWPVKLIDGSTSDENSKCVSPPPPPSQEHACFVTFIISND